LPFERFRATLNLAEGCHMGNPGSKEQLPMVLRSVAYPAVLWGDQEKVSSP
jgi:hypothetical protein